MTLSRVSGRSICARCSSPVVISYSFNFKFDGICTLISQGSGSDASGGVFASSESGTAGVVCADSRDIFKYRIMSSSSRCPSLYSKAYRYGQAFGSHNTMPQMHVTTSARICTRYIWLKTHGHSTYSPYTWLTACAEFLPTHRNAISTFVSTGFCVRHLTQAFNYNIRAT